MPPAYVKPYVKRQKNDAAPFAVSHNPSFVLLSMNGQACRSRHMGHLLGWLSHLALLLRQSG